MIHRRAMPILLVALLAWGCAPAEEGEQPAEEAGEAQEAAAEPIPMEALPDTTAREVWAFLQGRNYRTWDMWPGKGEFYEGTEPHGMLLTTYVDVRAKRAIEEGAGSMPPGALVVKENYQPDSTLASVTVMYKVEGYAPDHNDWFWMKLLAGEAAEGQPSPIAAEGRVPSCQTCHAARGQGNDYIITGSLGEGSMEGEGEGEEPGM